MKGKEKLVKYFCPMYAEKRNAKITFDLYNLKSLDKNKIL